MIKSKNRSNSRLGHLSECFYSYLNINSISLVFPSRNLDIASAKSRQSEGVHTEGCAEMSGGKQWLFG